MSDHREQLAEHLKFFGELGVAGFRKDAVWSARADGTADLKVGTTTDGSTEAAHIRSADLQVGDTISRSADRQAGLDAPAAHIRNADRQVGLDTPAAPVRSADLQVGPTPDTVAQLAAIREDIGDCVRCKLCRLGRKQIVFGVGNPNADLMFVGEAPGRDEDIQGIPFVGRAGQKLTQIIEAIGLTRGDVYIANVIKCRPPENRNPEPDEVEQCEPFLFRQVDTIKPKVIVALGTFAAKSLLKSTDSISRLRGRVYEYRGAKLVPTFHPAFLLRNPACRREVWEDMKKVRALLNGEDVA
jgi:DNA polymerase